MTPDELKQVETELRDAVAALRTATEARSEQDGLTRETIARINADIDRLTDAQADIVRRMRSPMRVDADPASDRHAKAREGVVAYLRRGDAGLTAEHGEAFALLRKELSVDSDPDGGYLVTPAQAQRIITKLDAGNPLRALASVQTISTDALEGLVDLDEAGAGWVSERQARPSTKTPQLGQYRIPVHEMYAAPKATQKLLDDASVDVEAWLTDKVARKFATLEAAAFVNGNGTASPRGIATYPDGTTRGKIERVKTGHATSLAPDGIVNIVYKLPAAYAANGAWLMNRATLGLIRALRGDGGGGAGTGDFLWQPGFGGQPSTLMGYPIFEAADMANAGAGGALVAAFGDFRSAYQIVDRQGVRVLRDPYTAKPYVELYTTKRVGGDVVDFDAYKLLVTGA